MTPERRKELGELLRKLLSMQRDLPAGALQIVGLDAVRQRLGAGFAAVHARIHRTCRRIIELHVQAPNLAIELPDEESWLLIFTDAAEGGPEEACRLIREEIARQWVGEADADGLRIELPLVTLARLCAEGSVMAELVREAAAVVSGVAAPPAFLGEPAHNASPSGRMRLAINRQERMETDHLPADLAATPPAEIAHIFRPVWDTQTRQVVANLCVSTSETPNHIIVEDLQTLEDPGDRDEVGWLDRLCVIQSLRALSGPPPAPMPTSVLVQVHYEAAMAHWIRGRYSVLLAEVPRHLKPHLWLEISGVPSGAPPQNLAQLTATFRPHCHEIIAFQPLADFNIATFAGSGCRIAGITLGQHPPSFDVLAAELRRIGLALKRAGIAGYLRDVRSERIAALGALCGFRYMSGTALFGSTHAPVANRALPADFMNTAPNPATSSTGR